MHIPRIEVRSLDETVEAVDLRQTPADVVFLSFSDSDLNALARGSCRKNFTLFISLTQVNNRADW